MPLLLSPHLRMTTTPSPVLGCTTMAGGMGYCNWISPGGYPQVRISEDAVLLCSLQQGGEIPRLQLQDSKGRQAHGTEKQTGPCIVRGSGGRCRAGQCDHPSGAGGCTSPNMSPLAGGKSALPLLGVTARNGVFSMLPFSLCALAMMEGKKTFADLSRGKHCYDLRSF